MVLSMLLVPQGYKTIHVGHKQNKMSLDYAGCPKGGYLLSRAARGRAKQRNPSAAPWTMNNRISHRKL